MKQANVRPLALLATVAGAMAGGAHADVPAALAARQAPAGSRILYVSAHANRRNRLCTKKAPCRTIAQAIRSAHRAQEILVKQGVYRETVTVAKMVTLVGGGSAVIDAEGLANGIVMTGAAAERSVVRGFVVEDANEEGILDNGVAHVTIERNVVRRNDRGRSATDPTGECSLEGGVPADCGEGLHLLGASYVTVEQNKVIENSGGIYFTDETGPSAHNLIARNEVLDNVSDCGITLAGHSDKAVVLSGTPESPTVASLAPTVGGIYDNTVLGNTVNGNGVKGLGAGIGMFGQYPGSAVYDNTIKENTAEGNGLGGVTLHSHAPGQDLSGNTIIGNVLSDDGIAGNPGGTPGDEDAKLTESAGIIIYSAVTKLTSTTVEHNRISNEEIGIWTENAPQIGASANSFASTVKTDLLQK